MSSNQMDQPLPQQVRRPFCFMTPMSLSSKLPTDTFCQTCISLHTLYKELLWCTVYFYLHKKWCHNFIQRASCHMGKMIQQQPLVHWHPNFQSPKLMPPTTEPQCHYKCPHHKMPPACSTIHACCPLLSHQGHTSNCHQSKISLFLAPTHHNQCLQVFNQNTSHPQKTSLLHLTKYMIH